MLSDELDNLFVRVVLVLFRPYLIIEIWTVKGAFKFSTILNVQAFDDVRTYLVCGSSRQCDDGGFSYLVNGYSYLSVFGTEVVAPFRNAMGLVDGIEANLDRFEEFHTLLLVQRFGSNVQEFGLA